ncbi:MAG TPA: hypothetical protein VFX88_10990 [Actinomycetota bacterium]|nr:hypothetical protein [Actinomycetota bacterium]
MSRGAGREVRPPRRVVLLSESMGLAALVKHLLGASGTLTRFATLREAADRDGLDDADTVVLDLPREGPDTALAQVRHRYRGELVVLADRGQGRPEALADLAWTWTLLERPFSAVDLGTALGLPGVDAATTLGPKAEPKPEPKADRHPPVEIRAARPIPTALAGTVATTAAEVKAAARRSPSWTPFGVTASTQAGLAERASRLLAALTQSWQARRRVRVAGFSVFALIAFTVAFALAAQSGRCGPGCDALGTVFSPDKTMAPASSRVPSTTGPKRSTTTTAVRPGGPVGPAGNGSFQGVSGGRVAVTTTTTRRATTTTAKPSSGGSPTTRPATTRPATTTPTTQPTTTPTTPTTQATTTPTPTTAGT